MLHFTPYSKEAGFKLSLAFHRMAISNLHKPEGISEDNMEDYLDELLNISKICDYFTLVTVTLLAMLYLANFPVLILIPIHVVNIYDSNKKLQIATEKANNNRFLLQALTLSDEVDEDLLIALTKKIIENWDYFFEELTFKLDLIVLAHAYYKHSAKSYMMTEVMMELDKKFMKALEETPDRFVWNDPSYLFWYMEVRFWINEIKDEDNSEYLKILDAIVLRNWFNPLEKEAFKSYERLKKYLLHRKSPKEEIIDSVSKYKVLLKSLL